MNVTVLAVIKQRFFDIVKQDLDNTLRTSVKCFNYQFMVENICLQFNLNKQIPKKYKTWICKFRMCSHNLAIEQGRFFGIDRCNRKCFYCKDEIEDEMHFILTCPVYHGYRIYYIKKYYWKKPSMYKYIQLMRTENVRQLCNLGKFIHKSITLRAELIKNGH